MAARGSLLLCVELLLAMPALAATPAHRDACAASAEQPDVGGAACSRIIDDAGEPVAERVTAFENRGRGAFNRKDYDCAIADYGEAIKFGPNNAFALAHRCQAYASKADHDAAIADCTAAIRLDSRDAWAYARRGMAWTKRVNSTGPSPISPRRSRSTRNTPLVSAKGVMRSSGSG
jgi:tetratricopeptide (TPR) repeat protein